MTRVAFMGSKASGVAILRCLVELVEPAHQVVGVLCPADTGDQRSVLDDFHAVAQRSNVPLVIASSMDQAEAALRDWSPEIVLVIGWYQRIRVDALSPAEFYGFHFSPLPRYRGNAPLVWQIIQGEEEIAVSLFRFTEGIDEGPLAAQVRLPLGAEETIADALTKCEACAVELLNSHLEPLLDGTAVLTPQESTGASYCGLRTADDGRINWDWSAERVHDFVRAQTRPYPGAYTHLPDGRRLRVWRTAIEGRPYLGVQGGVADRSDDWVTVTCGEGAIRVLDVEVEGEGQLPARLILTSLRLRLH